MAETPQLLAEYVKNASESAFQELVARYINLVHSVALRLVNGDVHLAQDVTQLVFTDLARLARTLSHDVMLGGWLHRHTCFVASNLMRRERRRQNRERRAVEMSSSEDHSEANLSAVSPILDEAINQLGAQDRQAILLRFFEQHDFRTLGQALGSNEEAARKRVSRALEKLHILLKRRGVFFSVASLTQILTTQAVSAAPTGMATGVAGAALIGAATVPAHTSFTLFTIMNTKLKAGLICVLAAGVTIPFAMQQKALNEQRQQNAMLSQQVQKMARLEADNDQLNEALAEARSATTPTNDYLAEILQLRGEIAALRTAANAKAERGPSALSGLTANPEMLKTLREQQKFALAAVYKKLATQLKLPKEQADKLNDLLADNVITNIEKISAVLSDGSSPEQLEELFAAQELSLLEQVRGLLGEEGLKEYQNYTQNLLGSITAQQFQSMMSGDADAQKEKAKRFDALLQEKRKQVLAAAGLGPDYQTVPTLNFRNFASEQEEQRNLKLLGEIYTQAAADAGSFLSAEDLVQFKKFHELAISNNKMILALNRKMMSPEKK